MHLLAWPSSQQESIGLPKCARVCMKKAAPSAASWGCLSSTYSCLCENHWFADGYNYCVRQGCGVIDAYDAKSQFETRCNKLLQRDFASYRVPQANTISPTSSVPYTIDYSFTSTDNAYSAIPITTPAPTAKTTAGPIPAVTFSPTTSSGAATTSSISASAAPSIDTSSVASGGVSQSAKVGIGLGMPLAALLLALVGYALYRYCHKKRKTQERYMGDIAAGEPYPAVDNADTDKKGHVDVGILQPAYKDGDPVSEGRELHGQHIPPYLRELQGSPAYGRRELPG